MEIKEVNELLEKQLQLLSEQSQKQPCSTEDMVKISLAMAELARTIIYPLWCQEVERASRRY